MSTSFDSADHGGGLPPGNASGGRSNGIWLKGQNQAFRAALDGQPIEVTLGKLTATATAELGQEVRCAFYRADAEGRTLHHVVGMPESYARRVDGFPIGEDSLACGLAASTALPVITADVREDPRWEPWLWLSEEYGYRGCWSFPVETTVGELFGTFTLYFPEPRIPGPDELDLAEALCSSAAIIIDQQRGRDALVEGEGRQAFRLALSDALSSLTDADEIMQTASRLLGDCLQADRTVCAEIEGEIGLRVAIVRAQHVRRGAALDACLDYEIRARGWTGAQLRRGEPIVIADIASDARLSDGARAAWLASGARALVMVSLPRNGREVAYFGVHHGVPRAWMPSEVRLIADVAERTWVAAQRASAEERLRESEEKYRLLFNSVDEGFCIIEVLFDPAGKAADYRFLETNDSFERQTGLAHAVGRTMRELNPAHEEHWFEILGQIALSGTPRRFERPAEALGFWYDVYAFRVGEPGQHRVAVLFNDIAERKQAEGALRASEHRAHLLLAELQHRVRNILFVIRSVFTRSLETEGTVEQMAEHFRGRLDALARTQVVVTQSPGGTADLENLVRDELLSVGARDGPQLSLDGPEIDLSAELAESMGLAVHELTTNSVKYGALSQAGAQLTIRWAVNLGYGGVPRLVFSWAEQGVPAVPVEPDRRGFGTELITQALPYRLGAETSLEFRPGGIRCVIELPLIGFGNAAGGAA